MVKKTELKELKKKLEEEKRTIETQLKSFAREDKKLKGDWDTKYPHFDGGVGSQREEEASNEVEAYVNLLAIEHSLEIQLRDVNLALEKIQKGNYGKCEKCGKSISLQRLKALPAARTCSKCK